MIDKKELMQMALEFCVSASTNRTSFYDDGLIRLVNAILERAAVECEDGRESVSMHLTSRDCVKFNQGLEKASEMIRALKTQG